MKKTFLALSLIGGGALVLYFLLRPPRAVAEIDFIQRVAKHYNPWMSNSTATLISDSINKWTEKRNLNVFTVLAIIAQESSFNPAAEGKHKDRGLMQLTDVAIDELERVYNVKIDKSRLYEIDYNIQWGTLYFLHCVKLAKGDRFEAIARYNKTTEWWEAKDYANQVLAKREEIIKMYNEFVK